MPPLSEFVVDAVDELDREKKGSNSITFPEKFAQNDIHLVAADPEFWRSSIIRLLVSFDTSSIFNATEFEEDAFDTAMILLLL